MLPRYYPAASQRHRAISPASLRRATADDRAAAGTQGHARPVHRYRTRAGRAPAGRVSTLLVRVRAGKKRSNLLRVKEGWVVRVNNKGKEGACGWRGWGTHTHNRFP